MQTFAPMQTLEGASQKLFYSWDFWNFSALYNLPNFIEMRKYFLYFKRHTVEFRDHIEKPNRQDLINFEV